MIKAYGHITPEGKLVLNERHTFIKLLQPLKGREIELVVKRRAKTRSGDQNAYYWGVVVHLVMEGLNDLGHDVTQEDTHDFLKGQFNAREVVNEATGEVVKVPRSTTELSTAEFSEYVERISKWAGEWLGISIPLPNEQQTIF